VVPVDGLVLSFQKKVKRNCKWLKIGKYSKRLKCCHTIKRCHSKTGRCRVIGKKCKWSSKKISTIPKKACFFKSYGVRNSRRKRCCNWKVYCIGKSCKPVQKQCKWVGFIFKKTLKTACNWKRKSKFGIQRKCCKYFRVCRIFKNRRQCKNGKSICKWKGTEITTKFIKHCKFTQVGIHSRRKLCCRNRRICKNQICTSTKKSCGFVGPKYSYIPISKCYWANISKLKKERDVAHQQSIVLVNNVEFQKENAHSQVLQYQVQKEKYVYGKY